MPDTARPTDYLYHKDQFSYDEASDSYTCPHGQRIPFVGIKGRESDRARLYRMSSGSTCRNCSAFGVCTKNAIHGPILQIGEHEEALRRHRNWMATGEAHHAYRHRLPLVEPLFTILKEQLGNQRFTLRGMANVRGGVEHACHAFNLRTLWRLWQSANVAGCLSEHQGAIVTALPQSTSS